MAPACELERWVAIPSSRETVMKKLGLFAVSVAAALACTAVPASFNWSRTTGASLSLDKAEAQIGRPLRARSIAGVNRKVQRRAYRRVGGGGGPLRNCAFRLLPRRCRYESRRWCHRAGVRTAPQCCDRERCHGTMVHIRTERLALVLDAIRAPAEMTGAVLRNGNLAGSSQTWSAIRIGKPTPSRRPMTPKSARCGSR